MAAVAEAKARYQSAIERDTNVEYVLNTNDTNIPIYHV